MLADCLTKTLPGAYTREVLVTNRWTFGPDGRAPSMRARTLMDPTRVKSTAEAKKLNDAMTAYMQVVEKGKDEVEATDVSTWPAQVEVLADPASTSLETDAWHVSIAGDSDDDYAFYMGEFQEDSDTNADLFTDYYGQYYADN